MSGQRHGSLMSGHTRTTPRLRCFRAGPGDICTLQDHLRHATEKRWRLEQTGIRQWNRNAVLISKLLELDQDFTAQWTREPYSENAIGVPGINTPARRLWYLIPVSYCTVRYWYRYHNKFGKNTHTPHTVFLTSADTRFYKTRFSKPIIDSIYLIR